MILLKGQYGGLFIDSTKGERIIEIPLQTSLKIFRKHTLERSRIAENALGLYSFAQVDGSGEAKFMNLRGPKHVLKPRQTGCGWLPKGKVSNQLTGIKADPIQYQGEQCPDFGWNGCMEMIYGPGNKIQDIKGTPAGQALLNESIALLYNGLGNSYFELLDTGQHPLIDEADAGNWFTESAPEWEDFKDQQRTTAGHRTIIDALKNQEGLENFNAPIYQNEVSGKEFIGNAGDAIKRTLKTAKAEMNLLANQMAGTNNGLIIKVTPSIFNALEEELIAQYVNIPESFYLRTKGLDGQYFKQENVIRYKGHWVMPDYDQLAFDEQTGTITHRIMILTPGIFGVAYDVFPSAQFAGMGMRIIQRLDDPWGGKFFMSTNFKAGAGIVAPEFMINASLTLTPSMA